MLYKNINTGSALTEEELNDLHVREWTELYNQNEEVMDSETYSCKFEDNMTLEQFIEYKKKHDVDNDFIEIDNILNNIMTFAEASKNWGLNDSTLRKLVTTDKLKEGTDYRKSGNTWLITREAMERVYGRLEDKK